MKKRYLIKQKEIASAIKLPRNDTFDFSMPRLDIKMVEKKGFAK